MPQSVHRSVQGAWVVAALLTVACSPARAFASGAESMTPGAGTSFTLGGSSQSDDDVEKTSSRVVMADFNRDGILDRAEATSSPADHSVAGFLTIWLGQSGGTFREISSKSVLGHTPQSIVSGDFNRDGIPDLIVGDASGALTLFVGDGSGNVTAAGEIGHLDSVVSIAVADFNHDGISDIAVSDSRGSSVVVLLDDGSGSFRSSSSIPLRMMGTKPHVAVADFDGDGNPDLAVVYDDEDGDTFDVLLGNGKGAFIHAPELSRVRDPNSHCVT
jgi:WD40 repeat protein